MTDQFPGATKMVLSPAARAVVNAAIELDYGVPTPVLFRRLAAALRAAADQVVPESCFESNDITAIRNALLAIADEFEARSN